MLFSYFYFSRIKFHRRCLIRMFIQAHLAFAQQHRYIWITVDIVVHRTIPSECSRHTSAINRSGMINAESEVAFLHIVPHRTHTVTHVSLEWSCSRNKSLYDLIKFSSWQYFTVFAIFYSSINMLLHMDWIISHIFNKLQRSQMIKLFFTIDISIWPPVMPK